MAEIADDWIDAGCALALLKDVMGETEASMAICARAHDGMIKARAERFIRADRAFDDVELPAQFWWARGHEALDQNWTTGDFETWIDHRLHWKAYGVSFLRADIDKLVPNPLKEAMLPRKTVPSRAHQNVGAAPIGTNVFIGHGRSRAWRELKDFVQGRLNLPWDEFNRVPVAGVTNIARLLEMLDSAAIALLVMTAEDQLADGDVQARLNVVHEAGLFQGRLGFTRAILLLEEGCSEFSNIQGLGQIRFPKGNIAAAFEEVRRILEREGLIGP